MIRINLLPVRAAKKKESARFQITVGVLMRSSGGGDDRLSCLYALIQIASTP